MQKRTLKGHISVIKNKQAEKMKKKLQEQVYLHCIAVMIVYEYVVWLYHTLV